MKKLALAIGVIAIMSTLSEAGTATKSLVIGGGGFWGLGGQYEILGGVVGVGRG